MITRYRTVFMRTDNLPRSGRADEAHVKIVKDSNGSIAYLGEVSGREDVVDYLYMEYITNQDPWEWVKSKGYSRPTDTV